MERRRRIAETHAVGGQGTSETHAVGQKKIAQIHAFATDVYNFIWTKHQFRHVSLYYKFCENERYSFWNPEHADISPFTDDIGTAVLCSQFLLREQCMDLFRHFQKLILHSKESFVYYVNLIQLILSEYRTDVFLRLIDTSAIIGEALLFWDSQEKPLIELVETKDILIDFFEEYITRTFFKKGGWKKLQNLALLYNPIYIFLTPYIDTFRVPYVIIYYDCSLINYLRECPVSFPVQVSWFCDKCRKDTDKTFQILNPESTIEELISKYCLQQPPWDVEVSVNIPIKDLQTGTSEYSSSVLKDEFYISLGGGVESADDFDLQILIENLPTVKPKTMSAIELELYRFFDQESRPREVRRINSRSYEGKNKKKKKNQSWKSESDTPTSKGN